VARTTATRAGETLDLVLLLSPAHCGGRRAKALMRADGASAASIALRTGALTVGDAFAFMSSLYFRGKLAYARAVVARRGLRAASYVITPTRGLLPPNTMASVALLEEFAATDIAAGDVRYRAPLERDLAALAPRLAATSQVVLLGSIATDKYVEVLTEVFGPRLRFPAEFVGRGDMSRGGLLLRCVEDRRELDYVPVGSISRRGHRPARLVPRPGILKRI
jgi:hypothetical protein